MCLSLNEKLKIGAVKLKISNMLQMIDYNFSSRRPYDLITPRVSQSNNFRLENPGGTLKILDGGVPFLEFQ